MKKLILATIVAIAGWFNAQAQSVPAPEKYNAFIEQVAAMEQNKAEFLMTATMETLAKDPKAYRQMMELAERRFSDAADPIHNEGLYMTVLKHTTEKFVLSSAEKEKQRLLLEGAKKNQIGSIAADFDYVTPDNNTVHQLKELKADHILVYFNNPDCESCETVKQRLANNELINELIKEKKLIVLAIYPYDDQKLWKKASYPKMMINGWNQSRKIEYAELYDLPTLPCFYLLDKDYKVLIKNEGSLNKVEAMLKSLTTAQEVGPAAPADVAKPNLKIDKEKAAEAAKTKHKRPDLGSSTPVPAPADDPNTAKSEEMMNYLLNNKTTELYDNLAEMIQKQAKPESFDNALAKIEEKLGKYQSHEPWEIRNLRGAKTYSSMMKFEKSDAAMIIVYDKEGKVLGFSVVPPEALK